MSQLITAGRKASGPVREPCRQTCSLVLGTRGVGWGWGLGAQCCVGVACFSPGASVGLPEGLKFLPQALVALLRRGGWGHGRSPLQ